MEKLLRYQIAYGIHGLVPCGTTGQSPTLSREEHEDIISKTVKIADGRVPVIAGAGSNNTAEAVEATRHAADAGADATLHVTAYYNFPSQQGVAYHFSRVAEAVPSCKVIIYNIPGRGHPLIKPEIMAALAAEYTNIIGTKDATGGKATPGYEEDASFWKAVRAEARRNGLDRHRFKIISGDDPVTLRMITDPEIEGVGVISVWSNIFPHAYARMCELALDGKYEEAKKINVALRELNALVGVKVPEYHARVGNRTVLVRGDTFRNPEPVQRTAYVLGMIDSPEMRPPMGFLPESEWEKQVGPVLYRLHESEHGDYLFDPIRDFFKPKLPISDRLMKYRDAR